VRAHLPPALLAAGLLGATLWPLTRHPSAEGFPLSTYPMFASHRPRLQTVDHVVARAGAGGDPAPVRPALLGTDEVMQAVALVRGAIARGPGAAHELCTRVAARIAASTDAADAALTEVEVRSDSYDAVAYFAGDRRARGGRVHARCRVGPRGQR